MSHRKSFLYREVSSQSRKYLDRIASLSPLERHVYWIQERESVRIKRKNRQRKPWTDDPVLRSYRFCNARRMDDKVSNWLLSNWYRPYYGHENMVLAVVIARHFNQPTTLEYIGFPERWDPVKLYRKIVRMKQRHPKRSVFNGAYIIRSSSNTSPRFYPDKSEMVIKETTQQFVDNPPDLDTRSMMRVVEELLKYRNFGTFIAGQVAADLRWGIEGEWKDRNKWAAIGPGSRRGMNRVHERPKDYPLEQDQFNAELGVLIKEVKKALPRSLTKRYEAIDYQNHLCETDKYNRVLFGEGRPKQKYQGGKP